MKKKFLACVMSALMSATGAAGVMAAEPTEETSAQTRVNTHYLSNFSTFITMLASRYSSNISFNMDNSFNAINISNDTDSEIMSTMLSEFISSNDTEITGVLPFHDEIISNTQIWETIVRVPLEHSNIQFIYENDSEVGVGTIITVTEIVNNKEDSSSYTSTPLGGTADFTKFYAGGAIYRIVIEVADFDTMLEGRLTVISYPQEPLGSDQIDDIMQVNIEDEALEFFDIHYNNNNINGDSWHTSVEIPDEHAIFVLLYFNNTDTTALATVSKNGEVQENIRISPNNFMYGELYSFTSDAVFDIYIQALDGVSEIQGSVSVVSIHSDIVTVTI